MTADVHIGADVGGTTIQLLAAWGDHTRCVTHPTGPAFGRDDLDDVIGGFIATLPAPPSALGIAVPGLVQDGEMVRTCDVLPRLEGWDAARWRRTGRVVLVNDITAACEEEFAHVSGQSAALVLAGTGIGAAFRVNGRPLVGDNGWAGELGSIAIATGAGPATIDRLGSGAAICRQLKADGPTVARRAEEGDLETLRCISEAGAALGFGLAMVVNMLNPGRLSVGGGALRLRGYADAALDVARRHSVAPLWDACRVRIVAPEDMIGARGALRLAAAQRDGHEA